MGVHFSQTWPTVSNPTHVSATNERAMQKIAGTFDMSAQEAYLTHDGTSTGDPTLVEGATPECPMIALIVEDAQDQSALTTAGSFGPVMDPADSIGRDLFMWRYEHTASGWKLTVYLSGIESSGLFDGSGAGRGFAALIAGLGEPL